MDTQNNITSATPALGENFNVGTQGAFTKKTEATYTTSFNRIGGNQVVGGATQQLVSGYTPFAAQNTGFGVGTNVLQGGIGQYKVSQGLITQGQGQLIQGFGGQGYISQGHHGGNYLSTGTTGIATTPYYSQGLYSQTPNVISQGNFAQQGLVLGNNALQSGTNFISSGNLGNMGGLQHVGYIVQEQPQVLQSNIGQYNYSQPLTLGSYSYGQNQIATTGLQTLQTQAIPTTNFTYASSEPVVYANSFQGASSLGLANLGNYQTIGTAGTAGFSNYNLANTANFGTIGTGYNFNRIAPTNSYIISGGDFNGLQAAPISKSFNSFNIVPSGIQGNVIGANTFGVGNYGNVVNYPVTQQRNYLQNPLGNIQTTQSQLINVGQPLNIGNNYPSRTIIGGQNKQKNEYDTLVKH